ncbi:MAG: hypothetical protein VXW68_04515 [SAR324 cluster bacterium]|nr:hypothetical protein [SAR324 cluster bacterium]
MKVGSERQAASRRRRLNSAVAEIGYTTIWNLSAGTLQIWPCYMGIYSDKALPELFYDLFLARTGSRREGGGEVGTGPEPVPRLLICFGRRI